MHERRRFEREITDLGLREYWSVPDWAYYREREFLEKLKAVYESEAGVPLSSRLYPSVRGRSGNLVVKFPVTQTDPKTGKIGKDKHNRIVTPWRQTTPKSFVEFVELERDGSFCLSASRSMAIRAIFGLDKPSNLKVLTDLKNQIEAAKAAGDTDTEAKLIISRIVSHKHDPGSMKQFNQDLASRYGIKNTIVREASRREAFDALKQGAPIIADLEGGWHWVLVQKSPQGKLWVNDPLLGIGKRKIRTISPSELGDRFELIVDAKTGDPITPDKAGAYQN